MNINGSKRNRLHPKAIPNGLNTRRLEFSLRPNPQTGLTLIEILIVVAIIGILSQAAVPSFTRYIVEHRRADAHHLLQANAHLLQRCLTLAGTYNSDCNSFTTSREGHYELTSNVTAQTWSLVATAVAGGKQQQDTDCASFTLSHTGRKSATGTTPDVCW